MRFQHIAWEAVASLFGLAALVFVMLAEYFASVPLLILSVALGVVFVALLLLNAYVPGSNTPLDRK